MARTARIPPEFVAAQLEKLLADAPITISDAVRADRQRLSEMAHAMKHATHFTLDGDVLVAHY